MGKKALYLKYSDFAPVIMDLAGIKKGHGDQVQLAKALGIKPQSITKFINRDQLPTDRVVLFWINNHHPMAKFEELIGGKKADKNGLADGHRHKTDGGRVGDGGLSEHSNEIDKSPAGRAGKLKDNQMPQRYHRREEDIYYSQVLAIRESGPEWSEGRQILKLFLHRNTFGPTCHLDKLHFIVLQESNFHPNFPTGTILVVDTNNVKITSAFYIFSYGSDSFALRKIDPLNATTVKVTLGLTPPGESRDMTIEEVRPLIVGRVVWAVYKI